MEPVGAARPGSRSGASAATGAGPHWCRERLIAAAPGRWRDGTGSGSWSCRCGCIRAAGGRVGRAAAMTHRGDEARPETVLDLRGGGAERAAQAGQLLALIRSERAKGIFLAARHGTPRGTRIASPLL